MGAGVSIGERAAPVGRLDVKGFFLWWFKQLGSEVGLAVAELGTRQEEWAGPEQCLSPAGVQTGPVRHMGAGAEEQTHLEPA